ncbi:MAG: glutamine--fructose-6-phosphate transaminase (isomerizing) [Candidatus Paceibacterota bacterium]
MCGIAGYIGEKDGLKIVLDRLKLLEYRGYDSAGVLFFSNTGAKLKKSKGKLNVLSKKLGSTSALPLLAVIGHTRWATHGIPNEKNAHPHTDCNKKIFLAHNGIIENYQELRQQLSKTGHVFKSQTDTEIIAHLIEECCKSNLSFEKAFETALTKVVGAYALAVVYTDEPERIYFAKLGSPLIIGVAEKEYFLASDPTALAGMAKKIMYLKDGQRGWLSASGHKIGPTRPKMENLNLSPEQAQKGKFPHFMIKEISEQPETVRDAFRGRLFANRVKLGGLENVARELEKIKRIEIIACGTSYHAGLLGELLLEEIAGIPTKVIEASEYRYRDNVLSPMTACLFISQSGETADTLAALRKANGRKALTLGLVNTVGSAIARETKAGVYNHAGPEIGVASTKAFTSQLSILNLIALFLAKNSRKRKLLARELNLIPEKIKTTIKDGGKIKLLAKKYQKYNNFMFLGRKYNYPAALEGALKLKEIGYVHAEGKAAGELKHGPIALIDKDFPTIALVNKNSVYEKMISNLEEIKTRGGRILAIATIGDKKISKIADDVIYVPKTLEPLEPLLNVIPLQIFAYYFGVARGHDVDKPRNLAKSVTVE